MAKNEKAEPIVLGTVVEVGTLLKLATEVVSKLPASEFNARGVVLANDRVKFTVMHGDTPVEYTASVYVQRAAVGNEEAAKVSAMADTRKATKEAKAKEEAERLAREKRAMFDLGQASTVEALRNINTLAQAASTLAKQVNG